MEACISSWGVDEGKNRQPKSIRMLHQAHGLAVSTGGGHAEITGHIFFGIAPFLMPKQKDSTIP